MPPPLRIEYEGARYHVMSRGDRREAIFLDDADRNAFLGTLRSVREDGVAGSCVLLDEQSFSLGSRDAAAEPGSGDEVAIGNLHATFQPAS